MKRAKIAVTGSSGFIGRHLINSLIETGHDVIAIARQPQSIDGVEFRQMSALEDMINSAQWAPLISGADFVVHLAAIAHQLAEPPDLSMFMKANAEATAALAEASRDEGVARLVFISSIGAVTTFSDVAITPDTPCRPDSDYGASKREAEQRIQSILGSGAVTDFCVIRPNLVYGPGNPGNMRRLLSILEKGVPLPLASVRNRRSFLYVGNLCTMIGRALDAPGASGVFLPAADPTPISTPELLRAIGGATGRRARLFPVPVWLMNRLGGAADAMLRAAGRKPKVIYALDRLTKSLWTDMEPTLDALGNPQLTDTIDGINASFD